MRFWLQIISVRRISMGYDLKGDEGLSSASGFGHNRQHVDSRLRHKPQSGRREFIAFFT
jgi:hypothetical protein